MNYDDGNSENLSSIQGSQQSIELSCSYSNPIDLSKRSKSDKVTELWWTINIVSHYWTEFRMKIDKLNKISKISLIKKK